MNPSDTITWLAATTPLTGCLWIPYVLDRFRMLGITRTFGNPQPGVGHTPLAAGAAVTYFFARAARFALYTAGVPVLRTLAFLIGFSAVAALLLAVTGVGR